MQVTRRVTVKTIWDGDANGGGYGAANMERDIGKVYKIVLWHETKAAFASSQVTVSGAKTNRVSGDGKALAIIVKVPVEADDVKVGIGICWCMVCRWFAFDWCSRYVIGRGVCGLESHAIYNL